MRKLFLISIVIFFSAVFTTGFCAANETDATGKRIVAYYPNWAIYSGHRGYFPMSIPWGKLTHVNYAFAKIVDGEVVSCDEGADFSLGAIAGFRKYKELHPHVKSLISIGGWSMSGGFHDAAATEESRVKFVKSAIEYMKSYGFDGIDIDWEYPTFRRSADKEDNPNDEGTPKGDASEKYTFTLLLKDLREALDEQGELDGKEYLLTAAVAAGKSKIEGTQPDEYIQYLDFINLMTYDIIGGSSEMTGHHSALYPNPNIPEEGMPDEYVSVDEAVKMYLERGVPKDKIVIGSPFYSKGWQGVKPVEVIEGLPGLFVENEGPVRGIWDGGKNSGVNPYYYIMEKMIPDWGFKVYHDEISKAAFMYNEEKEEFYSFEDKYSVGQKVDYVLNEELGGIIFWEVTADFPAVGGTELLDVIVNGFYGRDEIVHYEFEEKPENETLKKLKEKWKNRKKD